MFEYPGRLTRILVLLIAAAFLWGCEGDDGAAGPAGSPGVAGPPGPPGPAGPPADDSTSIGDGSALSPEEIDTLGKLQATITNVVVSSPPVVEFTVLDKSGNPAVGLASNTVRFTFTKLVPGDQAVNGGIPYWQSYVIRSETPDQPDTGPALLDTVVQPTTESGGTLEELGSGQYRYTFSTDVTNVTDPVAVPWEPNLTHRVGMEIRLDRSSGARTAMAPDNPVFDFVPDGGAGSGITKSIADTNNCEGCHFEFAEHGGQRKTVEYCVTCHNPGLIDPDSGESLDMAYMAHSIHMGHDRAIPYVIYRSFGTFDFSEVHYPQSQTYCETCHADSATHPDGDNWNEQASATTCGGCHVDGLLAQNYDPVTGQAEYQFDHAVADVNIGPVDDGECSACHLGAIGTAGPALSIHSRISGDRRFREELGRNFNLEILDAISTGPGETPVITFRVSRPDGTAYDIVNDPEFTDGNASLNLYVAWTTDDIYNGDELGATGSLRDRNRDVTGDGIPDIENYSTAHPHRMYLAALQRDIAADPGTVNVDGSYTITYFTSLPNDFTGDVMVSLGGHPAAVNVTDADNNVGSQRAAARSVVFFPGTERQVAFDSDKCNDCHKQLQFHGANRNGEIAMCLNCHNADLANDTEGFALGRMVHAIHAGSTTFAGGEFANVHFPQSIANCDACHVASSFDVARMTARAVSIAGGADGSSWLDDAATTPTSANCGACHNDIPSMAHFNSMGGQVGVAKDEILTVGGLPNGQEACAVCHGTGSEFDTARYHNPGVQ